VFLFFQNLNTAPNFRSRSQLHSSSITPSIQDCAINACPARVGCTPSSDQNEVSLLIQAFIKISFNGINFASNSCDNSLTASIFCVALLESYRWHRQETALAKLFGSLTVEFAPEWSCNPPESFLWRLSFSKKVGLDR
jgi:hypothetical protein